MKPAAFFMPAFALVWLAASVPPARAEGCPAARDLRLAGAFGDAEATARRCLDDDPDDVATWLELSRALGLQQQFAPALELVERGLGRYPDDVDLALWQVRLLASNGSLGLARERLAVVMARVPDLQHDRDTAMLAADIDYWGHDWPAAAQRYSSYLEAWPDDSGARDKLSIARNALARGEQRLDVAIAASLATGDRDDTFTTRMSLLGHLGATLRLGAALELRDRAGVAETEVYALGRWRGDGVTLEAGIGGDVGGGRGPELSAWAEAGLRVAHPLWASLRYWRLDFASGGAQVVSPGVVATIGSVALDVRYWLGLPDSDRATHVVIARARWELAPAWTLEAGGGGGSGADYLEPRAGEASGHWLGLFGIAFAPAETNRFNLGYIQRHESADGVEVERYEISLGWQATL